MTSEEPPIQPDVRRLHFAAFEPGCRFVHITTSKRPAMCLPY